MADVSVVIPARDEASTVGAVVAAARRGIRGADVVVVDDNSSDGTDERARAAGARVVASRGTGKGAALWSGVQATDGPVVAFLDADVTDPRPEMVARLVAALEAGPTLALVKATYRRPLGDSDANDEGGRVTALTARPALALLHPHLARLRQPLAGEVAARREALVQVPFVDGYGVDLGLVLDIARRFGPDSIGEVDLGVRHHRNRPLHELEAMAVEILRVALDRAGHLDGPGPSERPPLSLLLG